MIALFLGTSEGKNIVSALNEYTDNLLISTATEYGGELLKGFKYKYLNTSPLMKEEIKNMLLQKGVTLVVDASHPYAKEVTKNLREICSELSLQYLRYERPAVTSKYKDEDKVIFVDNYETLFEEIKSIKTLKNGVILNTTGSNNLKKFVEANIPARFVHRVLPSLKVMENCLKLNINIEDIVAIKGPISLQLNKGFIKHYDAKAIILKDSGAEGGAEEKLIAAIEEDIYAFIIDREKENCGKVYNSEKEIVDKIREIKNYG
jgi:precorrin-6A/cobalt-precorrin-6A reductase